MPIFPTTGNAEQKRTGLFEKLFPKDYDKQIRRFANKKVMLVLAVAVPILLFPLLCVVIACAMQSLETLFHPFEVQKEGFLFYLLNALKSPLLWGAWLLISLAYELLVPQRLWNTFRDFNTGAKGEERWATMEELREQYVAVPEKDETFPGRGGVPIAWDRENNSILIDRSSVNNYIIGTTRSGKGESFMFPTIDIYSRAEIKSSLVITDPKLEIYRMSKATLEARGYECLLLNLADPQKSMKFNPLQSIIDAYKNNDVEMAEELCMSFCFSLFNSEQASGDQEFWNSTGSNLLCAMILAHVADCIALDEERNDQLEHLFQNRKRSFASLSEEEQETLRAAYANIPLSEYPDALFLDRDVDPDAAIVQDTPIPPEIEWVPSRKYEKQVTMYSIYLTFSILASTTFQKDKTLLDVYFEDRPPRDRARLKYTAANVSGDKTKASIYATMIAKLNSFSYTSIAKMTSASDINLLDIGFGKKPYAIFLSLPDYDSSNYFIASIFLRQLYFILAKHCTTSTQNGKCDREVVFLLGEFGNIPPVENMAGLITVCLGRNIKFSLVVQSNGQLKKNYGEGSETIMGNCGNWYYLLSAHKDTRQSISEELGSESVLEVSRSGSLTGSKSLNESYATHYLLSQNELGSKILEGENVVIRRMMRKDKNNNDVKRVTPILNKGNQRFKMRYQYLTDSFPNMPDDPATNDSIDWPDTDNVDLDRCIYDIEDHFKRMGAKWEKLGKKPKK